MSDKTGIEWTDATWNPATGCTKVSPGCDHCYAETFAERWRGTPGHYFEGGFDVQLRPDKLTMPLRWKRPRRIFVNSMSDLFHDSIPDSFIAEVFAVMAAASQHTFQVLTKRHARMRSLLSSADFGALVNRMYCCLPSDIPAIRGYQWPLPNVWLGVSAENQQWADIRIPALLETPAAVRWVSAEPLIGPIEFCSCGKSPATYDGPHEDCWLHGRIPLGWVVVGGESGPGARPMNSQWVRDVRDRCATYDVPFLFKQWGGVRKKETGRELDGCLHDGYPERVA
jgi:protein gp37